MQPITICLRCFRLDTKAAFLLDQAKTAALNFPEVNSKCLTQRFSVKSKPEKQAIVASLTETLQSASSGVLVDYKGITVAEDTALRAELRENGVEYSVVKNTLLRRAADNVGLSQLDEVLNGTTSIAISKDDPIAPMRIINKYSKQMGDRFNIKAGFMDGQVLPLEDIAALAELPSKDGLVAQLLGMMLAPITSLAIVLKAIAEKDGEPAAAAEEAAAE